MDQLEFIQKCLELVELEKQRKALADQLEAYALQHGPQTVGPVSIKLSSPARKFDYEATWNEFVRMNETDISIEEYYVIPQPQDPPPPYYDYKAACTAARIKVDDRVVSNIAETQVVTPKLTVNI